MDTKDPARTDRIRSWPLIAALLCVLGAGALLLLPRAPELSRLPNILASANPDMLALMLVAITFGHCLRALRLHTILQSGGAFERTFHICNIGAMTNALLPLRAGEFCMAALLARDQPRGAAEALSKLLADRLMDLLAIAVYFLGALLLVIPADHAAQGGVAGAVSVLVALGGVAGLLLLALTFEDALAALLLSLGKRLGWNLAPLVATLRAGDEGLRSLLRGGVLLRAMGLSLAAWLSIAGGYWAALRMLNINAPAACAVIAMGFTVLGLVTAPAPAGLGTIHGAIVIALTLFGVDFERSLTYAITYHALSTGLNIGFGLIGLKRLDMNFKEIRQLAHTGRIRKTAIQRQA